jgi:uncharacterized ion transporter superfamily protein YfcC
MSILEGAGEGLLFRLLVLPVFVVGYVIYLVVTGERIKKPPGERSSNSDDHKSR